MYQENLNDIMGITDARVSRFNSGKKRLAPQTVDLGSVSYQGQGILWFNFKLNARNLDALTLWCHRPSVDIIV